LISQGFVEAKVDTSMFVFCRGLDTAYLLLYIDDIVLMASTPTSYGASSPLFNRSL
jgi:hypothetical protein